jgi:hypothetical protein
MEAKAKDLQTIGTFLDVGAPGLAQHARAIQQHTEAIAALLNPLLPRVTRQPDANGAKKPKQQKARATSSAGPITRWTADRRARRVPTFVIKATGLKTKQKIVARYGDGVTFLAGGPLPPVKK